VARAASDHLRDVLEAIEAIARYTRKGKAAFARDPMQRDAVAARLIQIGQAVKDAQAEGLDLARLASEIPWQSIAGMRDRLAHKYWQHDIDIVWAVVERDLPRLRGAVRRILQRGEAAR
jgi:uncharacterized protein with HEPN domain